MSLLGVTHLTERPHLASGMLQRGWPVGGGRELLGFWRLLPWK